MFLLLLWGYHTTFLIHGYLSQLFPHPYPPDFMFIAHPLLLESYYVAQAILEFSLLVKAEITEETFGYVQFWCIIASWARSHSADLHTHCVLCDLHILAFVRVKPQSRALTWTLSWISSGASQAPYKVGDGDVTWKCRSRERSAQGIKSTLDCPALAAFIMLFLWHWLFYSPGWPHYVVEDNSWTPDPPSLPPKFWDYRYTLPRWASSCFLLRLSSGRQKLRQPKGPREDTLCGFWL